MLTIHRNKYLILNTKLDGVVLLVLAENGSYPQWNNWTRCSVTCGVGYRSRGRTCTNPPPGTYGGNCSDLGSENQTAECNSGVDCPQLENDETAECDSGEDCYNMGNDNHTVRCNSTSCEGMQIAHYSLTILSYCTVELFSCQQHRVNYIGNFFFTPYDFGFLVNELSSVKTVGVSAQTNAIS